MLSRNWNNQDIRFETRNNRVWVCLTDMARATGKRVNDWLRLSSTTEYLTGLNNYIINNTKAGNPVATQSQEFGAILDVNKGGSQSGTWGIGEVATDFAQWCNTDFRIWVNCNINDIITGSSGSGEINVFSQLSNMNEAHATLLEEIANLRKEHSRLGVLYHETLDWNNMLFKQVDAFQVLTQITGDGAIALTKKNITSQVRLAKLIAHYTASLAAQLEESEKAD